MHHSFNYATISHMATCMMPYYAARNTIRWCLRKSQTSGNVAKLRDFLSPVHSEMITSLLWRNSPMALSWLLAAAVNPWSRKEYWMALFTRCNATSFTSSLDCATFQYSDWLEWYCPGSSFLVDTIPSFCPIKKHSQERSGNETIDTFAVLIRLAPSTDHSPFMQGLIAMYTNAWCCALVRVEIYLYHLRQPGGSSPNSTGQSSWAQTVEQ